MGKISAAFLALLMVLSAPALATEHRNNETSTTSSQTGTSMSVWDGTKWWVLQGIQGTYGGYALVVDPDRDRDKNQVFECLTNTSGLAIGAADSNIVPIPVAWCKTLNLALKANLLTTGANDTTAIAHLIVQFRDCLNGNCDSANALPIYGYGQTTMGVSNGSDTTNVGHLQIGNAGVPWSGEYDITLSSKRDGVNGTVAVNGRLYYYPNGMLIPLSNLFGRDVRITNLQCRVRNAGSNSTAGSASVAYNLRFVGFAQ